MLAGVVDLAFAKLAQVVAAAKTLARALNHDDMDRVLRVGPFHRRPNLARHGVVDGVKPLGPVKQQAGHGGVCRIGCDLQGGIDGHGGVSWWVGSPDL